MSYGCRGGVCGRCSTKVTGEVEYIDEVFADVQVSEREGVEDSPYSDGDEVHAL